MANHTIVSPPNDANQENVAPSADVLANVRSTAREALAAHIDRSAKESSKHSRGPRSSDAEKVEPLLTARRYYLLWSMTLHGPRRPLAALEIPLARRRLLAL